MGPLQVLASGICFGFLGLFVRLSLREGLSIGELLSLRFSIAALILWISLLIVNPQLVRIPKKQILISCLLGVFGYAVFSSFYFLAIEGISIPLAAMLLFTFPLFVNIGAHLFLNEKMTRLQVSCLALASFGLVLLLWGDISIQKTSAVFFGLGSGITYAVYVLVSGRVQKNVVPLSSSLYVITSAAIAFWVINRPEFSHIASLSSKAWIILAGISIFSTIAPLTLFLAGLQKMRSGRAAVIVMIEPVMASVVAAVFLQEILSPLQMLGGLLVLSGVIADAFYKAQTKAISAK